MRVMRCDKADGAELSRVYNEHVASTPHCYLVSPEEFEKALAHHREGETPHTGTFLVGEEGGKALGLARVSLGEMQVDGAVKSGGFIHFLAYAAGYRSLGQTLLRDAEAYLVDHGAQRLYAFQKYGGFPFYHLGFGNLSDQLGHVYALFRKNGYDADDGEFFLEWRDFSLEAPAPPDPAVEIVLDEKIGRAIHPGLGVRALRKDSELGVCVCASAGEYSTAEAAQDTFFVKWLDVEEAEQAKGWGRYLLQRALWEMRRIGYRHAVISADWQNFRALLFYTNHGFRRTDTVYGLANTTTLKNMVTLSTC